MSKKDQEVKKQSPSKDSENVPAEQLEQVEEHVEVHLDRDPNDPRALPVVDGNDQEDIDINVPIK